MLLHNDNHKLFEFSDEMVEALVARARRTMEERQQLLRDLREAGFDIPMLGYIPSLECGVMVPFVGCRIFASSFGFTAYVDMGAHDTKIVYSSVEELARSLPSVLAALPKKEVIHAAPF